MAICPMFAELRASVTAKSIGWAIKIWTYSFVRTTVSVFWLTANAAIPKFRSLFDKSTVSKVVYRTE